ncbi:MAG: hypothetical protein Q7T11_01055 [Deltaproteobacteria bacterium]|nr:hypothetical protein [Deltaproteobacteria bacterium]
MTAVRPSSDKGDQNFLPLTKSPAEAVYTQDPQLSSSFLDRVEPYQRAGESDRCNGLATRVAAFGDHNWAYYFWRRAKPEGALLIHYDSHDDLGYDPNANPLPPEGDDPKEIWDYASHLPIGGFIASALFDGTVDEVYWVVPDFEKGFDLDEFIWFGGDRTFYLAKIREGEEEKIWFSASKPDTATAKKLTSPVREISVHLRTKDDLPDFSAEKRPVILDIDEDGIAYTGFGNTTGNTQSFPSPEEAGKRARDLMHTFMVDKKVNPFLVTIAGSAEYSPTEVADDIAQMLVDEAVKYLECPDVVVSRTAPTLNISYLASSLYQYVADNRLHDPRLQNKADKNEVSRFNDELVQWGISQIDETKHIKRECDMERTERNGIVNRCLPLIQSITLFPHATRRGDYEFFIDSCEEYGLINLAEVLGNLVGLQNHPTTSPELLERAYQQVIDLCLFLMFPDQRHLIEHPMQGF